MYAPGLMPDTLMVVSTVLLALATVSLGLRLYVRSFLLRATGWDDAFLILAYVCVDQLFGMMTI